MIEVAVTGLESNEIPFAVGVLARGMRDNPNPVAAYGDDPLRRLRAGERTFGSLLRLMKHTPLVARRGEWIVGVCGMAPPGTCQLTPVQVLRMLPALVSLGPASVSRLMRWGRAWAERDPRERHWHLGPVAVEPALQWMGVGGQMMDRFCEKMDSDGEIAYLETEKPENIRFYEKFGFVTVGEAEVLGAPNWFMRREPARG